jgi:hypothetical protein
VKSSSSDKTATNHLEYAFNYIRLLGKIIGQSALL